MKKLALLLVLCGMAAMVLAAGGHRNEGERWVISTDTNTAVTSDSKTMAGLNTVNYKSLIGKIKFDSGLPNTRGWQNTDSVQVILYTAMADGAMKKILDSATMAVPCSLITILTSIDTLLYQTTYYQVTVTDTFADNDSIFTINMWYNWELLGRE